MYSYSQDTVSILYLLCTSITAFHLVLILVLMSIYWPKDRVTLGITFAVIYTIFMAIPASVLIYCLLIIPKPSGNDSNNNFIRYWGGVTSYTQTAATSATWSNTQVDQSGTSYPTAWVINGHYGLTSGKTESTALITAHTGNQLSLIHI